MGGIRLLLGGRRLRPGSGVIVALVVGALALRFLHDRPEDLGLRLDGDEAEPTPRPAQFGLLDARRTPAYWLLAVALVLSAMIGTAVMFDMQPLMLARGLSRSDAAGSVGLWGLSMAVAALPAGRLVDRLSPRFTLSAGCGGLGLGSVALALGGGHAAAAGAVVLLATGQSLVTATVGATAVRFFGREHHGAIRSSLTRLAVIATGVGPLAFGLSDRLSGAYGPVLYVFALACVPATVAALWLRRPAPSRLMEHAAAPELPTTRPER